MVKHFSQPSQQLDCMLLTLFIDNVHLTCIHFVKNKYKKNLEVEKPKTFIFCLSFNVSSVLTVLVYMCQYWNNHAEKWCLCYLGLHVQKYVGIQVKQCQQLLVSRCDVRMIHIWFSMLRCFMDLVVGVFFCYSGDLFSSKQWKCMFYFPWFIFWWLVCFKQCKCMFTFPPQKVRMDFLGGKNNFVLIWPVCGCASGPRHNILELQKHLHCNPVQITSLFCGQTVTVSGDSWRFLNWKCW